MNWKDDLVIILAILLPAFSQSAESDNHQSGSWRWTLDPAGRVWLWQTTRSDPDVTWDFGAELLFQIGSGHNHAVWFGAAYRQGAGFDQSATITPFNPQYIDSAQLLSWRWRISERRVLFSHWERWCLHRIDVRSPVNPFFTHAMLGFGTTSPVESNTDGALRAFSTRTPVFDGYLDGGPMIHGGPVTVLGNEPLRQAQADAMASFTSPLYKSLLLECRVDWSLLLLRESESARWRHGGDVRLSLLIQGDKGNFAIYLGHHPHDDFPDRRYPSSAYAGIAYRI